MKTAIQYEAFISYSHADNPIATSLQRSLERFGKPWHRSIGLRIFRDATGLAANSALWSSVEHKLSCSKFFVLVASENSARSPWVDREAAWWRAQRPIERMLIVVANGAITWSKNHVDFDWTQTTCLPPALVGAFTEEPLYVDLRHMGQNATLSLKNPRFRQAILSLAAPIHGKSRDEMDSEAIQQYRRTIAAATIGSAAIIACATVAAYELREARQETALADSRSLAAAAVSQLGKHEKLDGGILLAVQAWRVAPTAEAIDALTLAEKQTTSVAVMLGRHTAQITRLSFSGDSTLLASGDDDGTVILWDTKDWTQVGTGFPGQGYHGNLLGLLIDDKGSKVVTLEQSKDDARDRWIYHITVWDVAKHAAQSIPVDVLGPKANIQDISISPDGRLIAILADDIVGVWNVEAGRLLGPPITAASNQVIKTVQFVSRNSLLLAGARPLQVGMLSTETGRVIFGEAERSTALTISNSDLTDVTALFDAAGSLLAVSHVRGRPLLFSVAANLDLVQIPTPIDMPEARLDDWPGLWVGRVGRRFVYKHDGGFLAVDIGPPRQVSKLWDDNQNSDDYAGLEASPDGRWLVNIEEGRTVTVHDLDRVPSHIDPQKLDASCSLDQKRCIERLCAIVERSTDDKRLADALLDSDLQYLHSRLSATGCGSD